MGVYLGSIVCTVRCWCTRSISPSNFHGQIEWGRWAIAMNNWRCLTRPRGVVMNFGIWLKIIALQVVFGGKITIEHEMYLKKYTEPFKMTIFRIDAKFEIKKSDLKKLTSTIDSRGWRGRTGTLEELCYWIVQARNIRVLKKKAQFMRRNRVAIFSWFMNSFSRLIAWVWGC